MTIRITSECNQACMHCMQNSSPKRTETMTMETFIMVKNFILSTVSPMINLSGGEPTKHPLVLDMLINILEDKRSKDRRITLISNGYFLLEECFKRDQGKLAKDILQLMDKYNNFHLQITSVNKIYTKYTPVKDFVYTILSYIENINTTNGLVQNNLITIKGENFVTWSPVEVSNHINPYTILNRCNIVDNLTNGIVSIGRANKNLDKLTKLTNIGPRRVPKCFNMYSACKSKQNNGSLTLIEAINILKENSKTSNCIPMIKENGDIVFGEYDTCAVVANIKDAYENKHITKMNGPCGECYSNQEQELMVNMHLSIFKDVHKDICKSLLYRLK